MTLLSTLRSIRGPLASAAGTAVVLVAFLWAQYVYARWPFEARATVTTAESSVHTTATSGGGGTHDRIPVDAATAGALDIQLETVGTEPLTETIRAVATVVPDESRISHVHTRVSGWIEDLVVRTTGESVRAGQPLARIFSQELLSSQTEYLAARRHATTSGITSAVVASGRTRLAVLGMSSADIDAIEESDEPARLVTVVAPREGVVVNRGVTAGTSVDPSTTLVTIADLSRVWVLAEVPEMSSPGVSVGSRALLDFPASGRPPFAARVDFVYPTLTERTRTLRARLSVANPGGTLRPGLYGTASFESVSQDTITVPRDAVVDTGLAQHVFVATADRFEPRIVTLGVRLADRVEVREGLRVGERVVTSGVFLLDSESRLRATGGGTTHGHASPESPDPHAGHQR